MNAMAAVRRGDYAEFYRSIAPYVRKAQEVLGLVLPEDLGGRVQAGHLSKRRRGNSPSPASTSNGRKRKPR